MYLAAKHYVTGKTPGTVIAQRYYQIINKNSIYFTNDFNGYWELAHLPYDKGIDEHPAMIINKLLLIQQYVNKEISKKKEKEKKSK